jgi:hypothetical protein
MESGNWLLQNRFTNGTTVLLGKVGCWNQRYKTTMLQKNNTNLPLFWGFFVAFWVILVDQKRHIGYTVYTVTKQEQ